MLTIAQEWEARLHSSLRWEIRYNKVDAQVAEGWLIAPNDAVRRAIISECSS